MFKSGDKNLPIKKKKKKKNSRAQMLSIRNNQSKGEGSIPQ